MYISKTFNRTGSKLYQDELRLYFISARFDIFLSTVKREPTYTMTNKRTDPEAEIQNSAHIPIARMAMALG